MRWLELLVDLGRGMATALVAAYVFAAAMLLVARPDPSEVLSVLVVATGFVMLSLWVVLPVGIVLGYVVPRLAELRSPSRRFLIGGGSGMLLGGLGGAILGAQTFGSQGKWALSAAMAVYVALWAVCAVWLLAVRRECRDV